MRRAGATRAVGALLAAVALFVSGCVTRSSRQSPEVTTMHAPSTTVPARIISNYFIIEAPQLDGTTRRFLVDTGSSVNYLSAGLAKAIAQRERDPAKRSVRVRGASGAEVSLEAVTIRKLQIGEATFERVPALVYDFTDISVHLGLTIDGLLGFPLFRDTLLTLDYPQTKLTLQPWPTTPLPAPTAARVSRIPFSNEQNTPLIPVQMGNESFVVLIDTGSDGSLNLNPTGLHPRFLSGPRPGTIVTSLGGNRTQMVGRVSQEVLIGEHVLEQPIVDLTDQLSAIGGELLRQFRIIFDQKRNQVTFLRDSTEPVRIEARRSSGLAFARSPVYWRVLSVIPDTPTTELNVHPGDLVVRINGEPVSAWDFERYQALLRTTARITYTFLAGTREYEVETPVFSLVP